MSRHVAYKRSEATGNWVRSNFDSGLCFTLSFDRLEQMLREHNMPICKLRADEQIEHIEIDTSGITVFIEPSDGTRKK